MPFVSFYSSLRKVMLRTCMGTDTTNKKDGVHGNGDYPPHPPPNYRSAMASNGGNGAAARASSSAEQRVFDNGDIFSAKKADEFREALADVFPEDIPGLPRHRPGHYSPR